MDLFIDTTSSTGAWEWKLHERDDSQPHMIRLAAILADGDRVVDHFCRLVKPLPNWRYIKPEHALLHGIEDSETRDKGHVLGAVLARITMMIAKADTLAAHNADFHTKVLRRAFRDGELPMPKLPHTVCTMRQATNIVQSPQSNGRWKWPRLAEAYCHFAGEGLNVPADPVARGEVMAGAVHVIYRGILAATTTPQPAA
jgi:hypothetical protein